MTAEKTAQVVVRLPPDLLAALKDESEREERTVSQTIRLAVRRYLDGGEADAAERLNETSLNVEGDT